MPACSVCNLYLNSPEQMQQHLAGKAHAKKVKAVAKLEADAAAKTETAVNAEALRINEVTSQSVTGSDTAASHANTSNTEPPSQQFCDTCKVMLNSPEQAHQHYQGARHAKRLKLVVKGPRNDGATPGESESDPHHGFFFCSFCNVYVNSVQQMTIHREGSKHKKMVEAKKRAAEEQSLDMQPPTKTPKIDRGQTVSGRGQTVSGRGQTVSGRGQTVSGRGQTVSGRGQTVSGRGQTVPARGQTVSGRGQNFAGSRGNLFAGGRGKGSAVGRGQNFAETPSEPLTVAGILNDIRRGGQFQERPDPMRQTHDDHGGYDDYNGYERCNSYDGYNNYNGYGGYNSYNSYPDLTDSFVPGEQVG